MSLSILGVEVGARLVRGIVLTADHRVLVGAAEAYFPSETEPDFDPSATSEALRQVLYELGHLVPRSLSASISIGPVNSGVGSGPSLPTWLEGRARFLGEDLICSGEVGLAFTPVGPLRQVVDCCAEHDVKLERVDLAPLAAQRILPKGVGNTFTVGSGIGWQAGVRSNVVLAATQSDAVAHDARLLASSGNDPALVPPPLHRFPMSARLKENSEIDLGFFAPAVGTAIGLVGGAPANLLNGFKVAGGRRAAQAYALRQTQHGESETVGGDTLEVADLPAFGAGDGNDAHSLDPNLRDLMPFPVTEPMKPTARASSKPTTERLGGHGISGKSSQIDAMVGSGQRLLSVMTVIVLILVVAVALVITFR